MIKCIIIVAMIFVCLDGFGYFFCRAITLEIMLKNCRFKKFSKNMKIWKYWKSKNIIKI